MDLTIKIPEDIKADFLDAVENKYSIPKNKEGEPSMTQQENFIKVVNLLISNIYTKFKVKEQDDQIKTLLENAKTSINNDLSGVEVNIVE